MPNIYVDQWEWHDRGDEFVWRTPGGNAVGLRDMRSLPQQAMRGGQPQGYGLFVYNAPQPGMALDLGDDIEANITRVQRDGIESLLGKRVAADQVGKVIHELLVALADPTGLTGWKPIRGWLNRDSEIYLGGYGYFSRGRAVLGDQLWRNTRDVFQADYRLQRQALDLFPIDQIDRRLDSLRRWTGQTMRELGLTNSDDLLPDEYHSDGSLLPRTQYADNFNRGDGNLDGSTAGDGSDSTTWDEWTGDAFTVTSNEAQASGNVGEDAARLDGDVSTDDQEVSATIATVTRVGNDVAPGLVVAQNGTDAVLDCYRWRARWSATVNEHQLDKKVAGATTELDSHTDDLAVSEVMRITWDGNTVKGYIDDVEKTTASDSTHSNQRRGGLYVFQNNAGNLLGWDGFEHKDAVAVGRIMGSLAGWGGLAGYGGIAGPRGGLAG